MWLLKEKLILGWAKWLETSLTSLDLSEFVCIAVTGKVISQTCLLLQSFFWLKKLKEVRGVAGEVVVMVCVSPTSNLSFFHIIYCISFAVAVGLSVKEM